MKLANTTAEVTGASEVVDSLPRTVPISHDLLTCLKAIS